jgi:hypothetical protein
MGVTLYSETIRPVPANNVAWFQDHDFFATTNYQPIRELHDKLIFVPQTR